MDYSRSGELLRMVLRRAPFGSGLIARVSLARDPLRGDLMRAPPLDLSPEDRVALERRARSKTATQRDATRTRVILLAADGEPNTAIGTRWGNHYNHRAGGRTVRP